MSIAPITLNKPITSASRLSGLAFAMSKYNAALPVTKDGDGNVIPHPDSYNDLAQYLGDRIDEWLDSYARQEQDSVLAEAMADPDKLAQLAAAAAAMNQS